MGLSGSHRVWGLGTLISCFVSEDPKPQRPYTLIPKLSCFGFCGFGALAREASGFGGVEVAI